VLDFLDFLDFFRSFASPNSKFLAILLWESRSKEWDVNTKKQ
jgi:hypothetical protein